MDPGDEAFTWRSPDDETVLPFSRAPAALVQLASEHDVCVTGDGLAHCQKAGVGDLISALTQVRCLFCGSGCIVEYMPQRI